MALGLLALAMYISCIFNVVCASFSALAMRKLADAEANSGGIWALHRRLKRSNNPGSSRNYIQEGGHVIFIAYNYMDNGMVFI